VRRIWRVAKEWSDLRNAHSKSQQLTAGHSTEFKIAVIVLASHRAIQAEVAGDFYLIIIMVILMIIIILHHGADDYNHMGMQWDLQLGLHEGGY